MVHYTYLGQCGFLLEIDGTRIVTDPHFGEVFGWHRNYPAPCALIDLKPDAIIISHSHIDHLDPRTIKAYREAGGAAPLYVPAPETAMLERFGMTDFVKARAEESFTVGSVTITPIPCAHMELHQDANGDYRELSYLVSGGGKTFFFGGDMFFYPGLEERLEQQPIDLMFLPANGWDEARLAQHIIGNLTEHDAAKLAARIGAPYVPMHHDLYSNNGCSEEAIVAAAREAGAAIITPKLMERLELA